MWDADTQHIDAPAQMPPPLFRDQSWVEFQAAIREFQRNATSASGFTLTRPKDFSLAVAHLRNFLRRVPAVFRHSQHEFFGQILSSIETLERSPIRFYPNELLRLHLVKAEVLIECNEPAQALALLRHVAERPYLIEGDIGHMRDVLRLQQVALMMLGRKDEAAAAAWRGMFVCGHVSPIEAAQAFCVFADALHLSPAHQMPSKALPRLLAYLARIRTELRREAGSRITRRLRGLIQRGVDRVGAVIAAIIALAPRHLSGLPEAIDQSRGESPVLVTRAMGGIGDIIMMMPGLRALARQTRQPVHFATKKSFFPLFAENSDVLLHDIDGPPLDVRRFHAWYDLSFCPAGRYESRHRPNVKKGRVKLFAGGMGISEKEISAVGLRPHVEFSEISKRAAATFFAEHGLDGQQPVIAVQAFSRETYRDYPRMDPLIEKLAARYKVVVFHHVAFPLPSHPNIVPAFAQPLGNAFATFARCSLAVCADSSFFHVAAALDMPTVALFGPTDGTVRSEHHRKVHIVSSRHTFKCMPCWRNEDTPCQLTGTMQSACMMAIDENEVTDLVDRLLAKITPTVQTGGHCTMYRGVALSTAPP